LLGKEQQHSDSEPSIRQVLDSLRKAAVVIGFARETPGSFIPFVEWARRGSRGQLREQLRVVKESDPGNRENERFRFAIWMAKCPPS
jgi:hypothetical protein